MLGPFLSAVPSQRADGFPLSGPGSLFKKRPRRQDFVKSFGFEGGLQVVCDAAARAAGRDGGDRGGRRRRWRGAATGFAVTTADGRTLEAPALALAVAARRRGGAAPPPVRRAGLAPLQHRHGARSTAWAWCCRARKAWMPECAFLVPVDDLFFSCVTRDPFPDPRYRGFAFHFRPGLTRAERLARALEVLRVTEADLLHVAERRATLPSPALGHGAIVADLDHHLAGGRLMLTGNYFEGLAIEDCVAALLRGVEAGRRGRGVAGRARLGRRLVVVGRLRAGAPGASPPWAASRPPGW